jgi:hypothetical protein
MFVQPDLEKSGGIVGKHQTIRNYPFKNLQINQYLRRLMYLMILGKLKGDREP